jgi:hypothetical protein
VDNKINVQRHDREFLLDIKQGKFEYDELVNKAELIKAELAELYTESDLPSEPHIKAINELLIRMRTIYYEEYS